MIQDAISALKSRDFDRYINLVREALLTPEMEVLWEALTPLHPDELNIVDTLCAWPDDKMYAVDTFLEPALTRLSSFTAEDYRKLLELSGVGNDATYFISGILSEWVKASPEFALEYASTLATIPQENTKLLMTWAQSFANGAPAEAAKYVHDYFLENGRLSTPVRLLLLSLREEVPAQHPGLSSVAAQMVDAVLTGTEQAEYSWLVVVKLVYATPHASDVLFSAIDAGNLEAADALTGALTRFNAAEFGINKYSLRSVISRLVRACASSQAATQKLDHSLALMLRRPNSRKEAFEYLLSLSSQRQNVVEVFPSAFNTAFDNEEEFAHLLTIWLLDPLANLKSVEKLIGMHSTTGRDAKLSETLIEAADWESVVRAVRLMLALAHNGKTLCSLASEILRMNCLGTKGLQLGEGMLNEIFSEYPGGTEKYLKAKIETLDKTAPSSKVYIHVYENIFQWRKTLMGLPKVPELGPTDRELYAYRQVNARWNRDIQRSAEENSFWSKIYPSKNIILQGGKFAAYSRFGPPQITPLEKMEHSFELPSSELSDPLGGEMRRHKFLRGE